MLIECVPNFSEGNDLAIIDQITKQIQSVSGVMLLNVDPGKSTNRTVITMVGHPEKVIEAAFRAIQKAGELIDMRKHHGTHPRMGATDVCPLIPISGITMSETVAYARRLAERVGDKLELPVYLYGEAQPDRNRDKLSIIRAGEYEGFFEKIKTPQWKPDFGPAVFDPQRGATVIGARDFLVAFNVNLNTTSVRRANAIAYDVREVGRPKRKGDILTGPIATDTQGNPLFIPGSLKAVQAIGWFIKEYQVAQISMNLTNLSITPVHIAFDEVCKKALERGIRVTGSELVGLIPLQSILEAGKYFLQKQQRSCGVSEKELINIAIKSMGLNELGPFNPNERIIEYLLKVKHVEELTRESLADFADKTSSENPAPGGGSVTAYVGSLAIALGTMVANLSAHKKGWDDRWEEFSKWAEKGQHLKEELLHLVDADTQSFNQVMEAMTLPKETKEEMAIRLSAIQIATRQAIEVPFRVMQTTLQGMEIIQAMAIIGNPNSVSDAGVGAVCARSAILGAFLNVRINAAGYDDKAYIADIISKGKQIEDQAIKLEVSILKVVHERINTL